METITETLSQVTIKIINALLNNVDWITVLIVLFSGLIAKYYFSKWCWNNAFKTLIVSIVSISMYVWVLMYSGNFNKADSPKFFFGYLTATALYPLMVKPIEKLIRKTAIYWANKTGSIFTRKKPPTDES